MEVVVEKSEINGEVSAPPSKSYTHRAFIAASLSRNCKVISPLISQDTLATLKNCNKLGATYVRKGDSIHFRGIDEIRAGDYFYFGNSGTTLRFFISLLSLSNSPKLSVLDGDNSLRNRPNRELLLSIKKLGARIATRNFKAPLKVGGLMKGGEKVIIKPISSQFVSSLLFSLPLANFDTEIEVLKLPSRPYVEITLEVLRESGIEIVRDKNNFYIPSGQAFNLKKFKVPADFTSLSYLICAALIAGKIKVKGVYDSLQGDRRIIEVCKRMGAEISWDKESGVLKAEKSDLEGIEVDAKDIPDLVPTISVLAAIAKGRTIIKNVENLMFKEINRIEGIVSNLRNLGVESSYSDGKIVIKGGSERFIGEINSFGDHRMALAFSLLGLSGRVLCRDASVVSISFPEFFDLLSELGARIKKST